MEKYKTVAQFAKMCGVTSATIYNKINQGVITTKKILGDKTVIDIEKYDWYIKYKKQTKC